MVSSPLTLQSIQPREGADPQVVLAVFGRASGEGQLAERASLSEFGGTLS